MSFAGLLRGRKRAPSISRIGGAEAHRRARGEEGGPVRTTYFVSEEGLGRLLESLDAPHVYAAIRRRGSPQFADLRAAPEADLALRDARPSASPKAFLQPARERVAA